MLNALTKQSYKPPGRFSTSAPRCKMLSPHNGTEMSSLLNIDVYHLS